MKKFKRINCSFIKEKTIDTRLSFDLTDPVGTGRTIEEWQIVCYSTMRVLVNDPGSWYLSYFVALEVVP